MTPMMISTTEVHAPPPVGCRCGARHRASLHAPRHRGTCTWVMVGGEGLDPRHPRCKRGALTGLS